MSKLKIVVKQFVNKYNQISGILLSIVYSLIIRLLAEFNVIEINSISFLLITPTVMGFIPFFLKDKKIIQSFGKALFYPFFAVAIFFLIAIVSGLEDIICLLIIGFPFIVLIMLVSIILYVVLRDREKRLKRQALPIFLLPVVLGMIEKEIPKQTKYYEIERTIEIQKSADKIYSILFSVPDLRNTNRKSFINYLGVPQPIRSSYNPKLNIREGYFENGIVLSEKVIERDFNKKLVFSIQLDKCNFKNSPTLSHVFESKSIKFQSISYDLLSISPNKTKVKLKTKFHLNSQMIFYGEFWSNQIITNFEETILNSLKKQLENR